MLTRDDPRRPDIKSPTLVGLLRSRAEREADRQAYTFLGEGEGGDATWTYGELDRRARAVAALLREQGQSVERVVLLYPAGLDYIAAFFGCLYAGVVAVPVYPPRFNQHLKRLEAVIADARAETALTTTRALPRIEALLSESPALRSLRLLATDGAEAEERAADWRPPEIDGDSLAFLQYTSGSTGSPKGVMLSHRNLLHNSRLLEHAFGYGRDSYCVSWLPLYHDMGLIGGVLQPLHGGYPAALMAPASFLQSPFRWLRAVSARRATVSGGPNFAYDLCVRKISPEQRATLDLSSWSAAFNGSEPVRPETLERFAAAFASCGFRREAFYPCYGLAEATLIVTGGAHSAAPVVKQFSGAALADNRVVEAGAGEEMRPLVSSGRSLLDQRVLIVRPETLVPCAPGEVGEIWVAGESVARGYFERAEETERVFGARLAGTGEGPFLRTGDLGFLHEGELFVTGRLKDLIIIRGRNFYPQDIEAAAEASHAALSPGSSAAFSVEAAGEERLVILQEVKGANRLDLDAVVEAIRRAVTRQHELSAHAVALLPRGSLLKTSSGKIQRHACRAAYLKNELKVLREWRVDDDAARAPTDAPGLARAPATADEIESWLVANLAARLSLDARAVDVNEPLGSYGADSLLTTELAHDLESCLGVSLSVATLLQGASIRELAAEASARLPAEVRRVGADAGAAAAEFPLAYGQQALWFLQQLAPDSAAYNIARAFRVRERLDPAALKRALRSLAEAHDALRTVFPPADGRPSQRVREDAEVSFVEHDAAAWDEAELRRRLAEEAHRPFDLARGPLVRVGLYVRAERESILLLTVHHIIADLWSLRIVLRELWAAYGASVGGGAQAGPAPRAHRYADYVRWQAEMLEGPRGESLWTYWREQLAGELPTLALPTDRPRPSTQTFTGRTLSQRLGAHLHEGLKAFGRRHGVTLYTVLLAAFQTLLHRYTGQDDIVVGSPVTGRTRPEWAGVVGYFVNPVALRARFSEGLSFDALLGQVRRSVLGALDHQDMPFPLLVERLQAGGDPARPPGFQVMFIFQGVARAEEQGMTSSYLGSEEAVVNVEGVALEHVPLERFASQFDLTLAMAELEDGLAASVEYNSDLFEEATVRRMMRGFETLLEGVIDDSVRSVSALPLLDAEERRRVLYAWNEEAAAEYEGQTDDPGSQLPLQRLFERQAARDPGAPAVAAEGGRLTYGQLNERANLLARRLRAAGVGADSLVGVCAERSEQTLIALLGVLKAGGAYVPLDPSYPRERIAFMLEDARVRALVTERHLKETLPAHGAQVFCLDDAALFEGAGAENVGVDAEPESLAYVIYTSGSTGRPKGVQVPHRALTNFLHSMRRRPGLRRDDVLLAVTSLSFDIAALELFLPLLCGARVEMASRAEASDAVLLAARLRACGATVMQATPSTWAMLVDWGWRAEGLRVLCGGEALPRELAARLVAGGAELWNMYGPTETTVWSAVEPVSGVGAGPLSIGRPIAHTRLYVLDGLMQPAAAGVSGELLIGGRGVARGYLRRPGLTAERFVPDPFSTEPGARLYRTGDVARWLADGRVECLGRNDQQVKLRGHRIELGEVEAALESHAHVGRAVAAVREGQRLVAYVTGVGGEAAPAGSELREHVRRRLPDYMVPGAYVELAELPLTPNGKVDRKALPAVASSGAEQAYVAPSTPAEELIAGIWSEVLGVERVGVNDSFMELGGHSLLATRLHARICSEFRTDLVLRELFERPTVGGLIESLAEKLGGREIVEEFASVLIQIQGLSEEEVRLLLEEQAPGSNG